MSKNNGEHVSSKKRKTAQELLRGCADTVIAVSKQQEKFPAYWRYITDTSTPLQTPEFYFTRDWYPAILKQAANGSRVLEITTEYPTSYGDAQRNIEQFFALAGDKFRVVEFSRYSLHPMFSVHKFILSWLD